MSTRIGYIDFLNSLPVYYGLETGAVPLPPGVELVKDVPAQLNRRIASGELDVTAMSSIPRKCAVSLFVSIGDIR